MSTKNPSTADQPETNEKTDDVTEERVHAYDEVSQAREAEIGMGATRL